MPKLRNIRKKPKLDMNPMVDMAFLLVSFFMMTTTFKAELPEEVRIPPSSSEIKLPEKGLCTVTLGAGGTVYFSIDNKFERKRLLDAAGRQYGISFTEKQQQAFSLIGAFGVPAAELEAFLDARLENRPYEQSGIPLGENGELRQWILSARMINPRLRFAVNADAEAKYPEINEIIETFRDLNITRFNIVTDLKPIHAAAD